MHYMIYQTKCKVYNTKNNKYITLCEKDYYVLVIELLSILRSFFSYGSSLVPIYDCGSCLLPQADERIMEQALVNEDVMNARIYQFPTSAIKLDGRKINYYDFLMSAEEPQCNAAIQRMVPKLTWSR